MKSRKFSFILALTLLVFTLLSCRDPLPRDYREAAFFAEIRYEYGGEVFCADVNVGAPSETGGERDIEMKFTSPPSLSGLCVSEKDGYSRVILGSAEVKSETAADRFLFTAHLLIHEGNMKFTEKTVEDGLTIYKAEIFSADKTISLLLDSNGIPKLLSYDDIIITVIRFK